MTQPKVTPRLVVDDASSAIDFYTTVLGATELARFADSSGKIVHAEIKVGDDVVSLTDDDGHHNLSPKSIGGSPLLLTVVVDDADAVGAAFVDAGSEVVIPIDDRHYGRREGRLRDPFGHLWIISQDGADLSEEEIQRRVVEAG